MADDRGELVSVTWDGSPLLIASQTLLAKWRANVREGEARRGSCGGGSERLAVNVGEFPAFVCADHSWLCCSTAAIFLPVCCMHDESLMAFVLV